MNNEGLDAQFGHMVDRARFVRLAEKLVMDMNNLDLEGYQVVEFLARRLAQLDQLGVEDFSRLVSGHPNAMHYLVQWDHGPGPISEEKIQQEYLHWFVSRHYAREAARLGAEQRVERRLAAEKKRQLDE